jgi:hypothetical protein
VRACVHRGVCTCVFVSVCVVLCSQKNINFSVRVTLFVEIMGRVLVEILAFTGSPRNYFLSIH